MTEEIFLTDQDIELRQLRAEIERLNASVPIEIAKGTHALASEVVKLCIENGELRAEVERLETALALERRRLAISEEALRRALENITTLEGMLGEMNIAVPEEPKP